MTATARFTDPIAAFDATVRALDTEDWRMAARLCDPVSLRSFQRNLLAQFAPVRRVPEWTVDDMLRFTPDMPREVAEYQVKEHRRHSDPARRLRDDLPGVDSVDALSRLSPAEAFAAWLDGRSVRRQIENMVERGQISPETASSSLAAAAPTFHYVAIGAVEDGERIAHVLYRMGMDETAAWQGELAATVAALPEDEQTFTRDISFKGYPQVATCRRQPDGTWALIADHSFLGTGATFISDVRTEQREPEPELGGEDC